MNKRLISKALEGFLILSVISFVGCEVYKDLKKDLNNVTVCSEVGLYVDTTKDGKYRVNGKEVTRQVADSVCVSIYNRAKN